MMEDAMTNLETDPTTIAAARAVRTQLMLVLAELRLHEDLAAASPPRSTSTRSRGRWRRPTLTDPRARGPLQSGDFQGFGRPRAQNA
jgi:hypothetical protein